MSKLFCLPFALSSEAQTLQTFTDALKLCQHFRAPQVSSSGVDQHCRQLKQRLMFNTYCSLVVVVEIFRGAARHEHFYY